MLREVHQALAQRSFLHPVVADEVGLSMLHLLQHVHRAAGVLAQVVHLRLEVLARLASRLVLGGLDVQVHEMLDGCGREGEGRGSVLGGARRGRHVWS